MVKTMVKYQMESLSIVKPIKDKKWKRVKKGTYVHCNRFNGTKSDRKYWSKVHPRAYVDFIKVTVGITLKLINAHL